MMRFPLALGFLILIPTVFAGEAERVAVCNYIIGVVGRDDSPKISGFRLLGQTRTKETIRLQVRRSIRLKEITDPEYARSWYAYASDPQVFRVGEQIIETRLQYTTKDHYEKIPALEAQIALFDPRFSGDKNGLGGDLGHPKVINSSSLSSTEVNQFGMSTLSSTLTNPEFKVLDAEKIAEEKVLGPSNGEPLIDPKMMIPGYKAAMEPFEKMSLEEREDARVEELNRRHLDPTGEVTSVQMNCVL